MATLEDKIGSVEALTENRLREGGVKHPFARSDSETGIRVMHVITGLDIGGTEMMLWKLLSASSPGLTSMVVSLGDEGTMAPKFRELGIPVRSLNFRRSPMDVFRLLRFLSLIREFQPRIIQGWLVHGNLVASLSKLAVRNHIPVFWNIRQSLYDMSAERVGTGVAIRAGAFISQFVEKIVYASETSARHHEKLGYERKKSVVVPNGFDCQKFHPDEEAHWRVHADLGLRNGAVLVGLVARYHPMKDHAGFLKAAGIVARKHEAARFLLAGRGVTNGNSDLEEIIDKEGLRDRVFLLGERLDIAQITAGLDIACSASWTEGFANSIGEAMACAVPCVATDVGDSMNLVGDTGLIVLPRNPEFLARAICELIDIGPEKRKALGLQARKRIEKHFSLPEIAHRYERLYQDCLKLSR